MSVRDDLAAAANAVDGVNVTPYFRATTQAGEGMVRLDNVAYPNRLGGVVTWQVVVMLPQDIGQAERFAEDRLPALVAAVQDELEVVSAAPRQLQIPVGDKKSITLPCLVIEGLREQ